MTMVGRFVAGLIALMLGLGFSARILAIADHKWREYVIVFLVGYCAYTTLEGLGSFVFQCLVKHHKARSINRASKTAEK